jgi:transcriptional regulator with XRE-family HTH domain
MRLEEAFGEQLRKYRLDRNLTQADLALRSGVTTRYLRNLEHGLSSPTLAVIVKLAASLEVEAHELVKQAVDLTL